MVHIDLGSMFLLGLAGTGHCLGMCGPLVLAFPSRSPGVLPHLLYHLGRVGTYVGVGALVAALGSVLTQVALAQVLVSLVAALLLALLGLARLGIVAEPQVMRLASPARIPGFGRLARAASGGGSLLALLPLGALLGLLPCGLSYGAFAYVLPSGGASQGAILVLAFALGTVPGLLLLGTVAAPLARRHRRLVDALAGLLLVGMAARLLVDAVLTLTS